jgi:methyl-accepting chemotaxis protein
MGPYAFSTDHYRLSGGDLSVHLHPNEPQLRTKTIEEVEVDIDEIQEDIDEIQEDVDEIQEDVEDIGEADEADLDRKSRQVATLDEIRKGLEQVMEDLERYKKQ